MSLHNLYKCSIGLYICILLSYANLWGALVHEHAVKHEHSESSSSVENNLAKVAQRAMLNHLGIISLDPNATMKEVAIAGVMYGFREAIITVTSNAGKDSLKFVPYAISKFPLFITAAIYKIAFGSQGVNWNDLAKINNYIYRLCLPYTFAVAGSFDKIRRAEAIKDQQEGGQAIDKEWEFRCKMLITELDRTDKDLDEVLQCYNLKYIKGSKFSVKINLARLVHALSGQDNKKISHYIQTAKSYIRELIKHFNTCKSLMEIQQRHVETRNLLSGLCNTFEQIAEFVDSDENGQNRQSTGTRKVFLKLGAQSSNTSMNGLVDSFLSSSSMATAA